MSFSVEGQKCPACGAYLFDNDDVVFCPQCGAPHHRDCYQAIGHCALEDKHGTDEQYKKPSSNAGQNTEENNNQQYGVPPRFSHTQSNLHTPCRSCGADVPVGSKNCPSCGAPIMGGYTPFGAPIAYDPMGGVGENEEIDGIKATEIKDFVAVNTPRYVPKIFSLNKKKKASWNWAAFLFPDAWFFYRKMYMPGIFFFLFMLATQAMTIPLSEFLFGGNGAPEFSNYPQVAAYLLENMKQASVLQTLSLAVTGLILGLVVRIIAGIFGDWIYRGTVLSSIKEIKENSDELTVPLNLMLRKKGAVNIYLGLIMLFFAMDFAILIISALL